MAYTKTTTTSYGSRLGSSFKAIFAGIILFIAATILLFWNEGRAVRQYDNIKATQKACMHVDNVSKLDGDLENQCIHATAEVKTNDILTDGTFGISVNAIELKRDVEYFQYVEHTSSETKDKVGGSQETTTTYTYEKDWVDEPIESSEFEDPSYKRVNSTFYTLDDMTEVAQNATFGAYKLSSGLISSISGSTETALNPNLKDLEELDHEIARLKGGYSTAISGSLDKLAEKVDKLLADKDSVAADVEDEEPADNTIDLTYVHVHGNVIYIGRNETSPEIGDVRITYTQVNPGTFSVIGKVVNGEIQSNKTDDGAFSMIKRGNVAMEDMFKAAEESNNMWTWILRILGIILVYAGLKSMFGFFITVLKVLPFLSNIADVAGSIVCGIFALVWSFLIIAIAWLIYHPLIALCILVPVGAGIFFLVKMSKDKKKAAAAVAE